MKLKIKKLDNKAELPKRGTQASAGLDLTCTKITTELGEDAKLILVYHTGLSMEIPEGYMGLLFPRSSIAKKSLTQTNCVGIIDSDYRGEIMVKYKTNTDVVPALYKEGERFVQLVIMPYPEVEIEEVQQDENLTSTERGEGGFGHTNDNNK